MKSRYDRNPGKDASIANVRQKRMEQMHDSADSFVKAEQARELKTKQAEHQNWKNAIPTLMLK